MSPWSLSLGILQGLDDVALWRRSFWRPWGNDPLEVFLETLYTGAVAASRLPTAGVGSLELSNKLRAFAHFSRASRTGGSARDTLAAYDALWAEEGSGYALARQHRGDPVALREATEASPRPTRVERYSGLGLALAIEQVTDSFRAEPPAGDLVARFVDAVDESVTSRYRLAALEPLGLAVRTLRPEHLADVGRQARDVGLAGPFWHGAGRGLYFSPTQLVRSPETGWSALDRALAEAPDGCRPDCVAGLAWALTLVNVRHPRVVERRLRPLGFNPQDRAARWAAQGVASALMLWQASTGDEATGWRVADALPDGLRETVRRALDTVYPGLRRDDRLADLFEYRAFSGYGDGRP